MTTSLIPERPLLISPTLAATIGLEEAVLLHVVSELVLQHPPVVRQQRRYAELNDETLIAALPFWALPDIKRVQKSLQDLGLLLVEPVAGRADSCLLAINQQLSGKATAAAETRSRAPVANTPFQNTPVASKSGVATRISPNWQPDITVFQQCSQRNIPRDFIEKELPNFIMNHSERGKTEYSWSQVFFKWLVVGWEKQRSQQSTRVLESTMSPDWQPSDDAVSILEHGGISLGFIEEAVPEFVLYWREKGTSGSEWNSRFIAHVRRQWERYAHATEHDNTPRPIPRDFKPDPACFDVLAMANIDADFAEAQVIEFVLYWQDRNEIHRSWNSKFLQHVKYKWAQQSQVGLTLLERITDRSWAD